MKLRHAFFLIASGMVLEHLRWRIDASLFAVLQRHAAKLNADNVLKLLHEQYGVDRVHLDDETDRPTHHCRQPCEYAAAAAKAAGLKIVADQFIPGQVKPAHSAFMPVGYFSLILHAHLPFVRHPEYPEFLEEDWLYEAITEVYLPLIFIFQTLHEAGAKPRLAMNVSPPLCEMLADKLLQERYTRHLENLIELAKKSSTARKREAPEFLDVAQMYVDNLTASLDLWNDRYERNLDQRLSRAAGRRRDRDHHLRSDARIFAADLDAGSTPGADSRSRSQITKSISGGSRAASGCPNVPTSLASKIC